MGNLEQLTIETATGRVNAEDLKSLDKKEQIFAISGKIKLEDKTPDELVELEIALRKCERVGFFNN